MQSINGLLKADLPVTYFHLFPQNFPTDEKKIKRHYTEKNMSLYDTIIITSYTSVIYRHIIHNTLETNRRMSHSPKSTDTHIRFEATICCRHRESVKDTITRYDSV